MEGIEFHLPRLPLRPLKLSGKLRQPTAILPDHLRYIWKKLCGGRYPQIAQATWRFKKVRKQFVLLFLKEINRGCSNMCSKKNPGILRKTSKDIVNFTLTELDNELKNK